MAKRTKSSKRKQIVALLLIALLLSYVGFNISVDISKTDKSVGVFINKSVSTALESLMLEDQSNQKLLNQIRSSTEVISSNLNILSIGQTLISQVQTELNSISYAKYENPNIYSIEQIDKVYLIRLTATNDLMNCFYQVLSVTSSGDLSSCLLNVTSQFKQADNIYNEIYKREKKFGLNITSNWVLDNSSWSSSSINQWAVQLVNDQQVNGNYSVNVVSWAISPTPVRYNSNGYDVLPPTQSIDVSAVIQDNGTYIEDNVPIKLTFQPTNSSISVVKNLSVSLLPLGAVPFGKYNNLSSSKYVNIGPISVNYSQSYSVSLQVGPVNGQLNTGSSQSAQIQIAPNYTVPT